MSKIKTLMRCAVTAQLICVSAKISFLMVWLILFHINEYIHDRFIFFKTDVAVQSDLCLLYAYDT